MPTATCFGMTQDAINELIAKRVEEALKAYDTAKNPGTETEMENEQQDENVKANGGNGNGNGNGNRNPNVNNRDAIRISNNLMDQKLKGYAIKNAKNKRRFDNSSRDNRGQQQQPFKRQNINGQNVARANMVGNNVERKRYVGALPYCNQCIMHHEGPCMVICGNYNKVGHMTRDFRTTVTATAQRALVGNQTSVTCHIIVVRAENYPPMLEKSMYDSRAICIRLFIKGKKNGRMMLDSIDNGPLVYPTIK
nr:reverse transcriptase domain-containing protein [Tanacetum cinerariifolium]